MTTAAMRKEHAASLCLRTDNSPWIALRGQWATAPKRDMDLLPFNPTPGKAVRKHSALRAEWGESDSDTDSDTDD